MLPFDDREGGTPAPPAEHTVTGISLPAQPWTLRIFPQGVSLTPQKEGHPSIHILHSELATHVQLLDFGLTRRTLVVRKPVKRNFKLEPAAWSALTAWMGRDARLRLALRQRLGWGVPLGVFILIASVPLPGDPAAGLAAVPFDPFSAILGVLLIASAVVARRWPHPFLFLVDSTWLLVLAASISLRVAFGASPLWLILVAMQLMLVWSGISLYRDLSTESSRRRP